MKLGSHEQFEFIISTNSYPGYDYQTKNGVEFEEVSWFQIVSGLTVFGWIQNFEIANWVHNNIHYVKLLERHKLLRVENDDLALIYTIKVHHSVEKVLWISGHERATLFKLKFG